MVLLVQGEQTGVGDLGVLGDGDLLLPFKQEERLESWRRVHLRHRCVAARQPEAVPAQQDDDFRSVLVVLLRANCLLLFFVAGK